MELLIGLTNDIPPFPSSQLHKRWANAFRGMGARLGRWHGHFRSSITEITDSAKGGIGSAGARTPKAFFG